MLLPYLADFFVTRPPHGQLFWGMLALLVVPLLLLGMALIRYISRPAQGEEGPAEL